MTLTAGTHLERSCRPSASAEGVRYHASDTTLKHDVAVKILPKRLAPTLNGWHDSQKNADPRGARLSPCAQNYWLETQ